MQSISNWVTNRENNIWQFYPSSAKFQWANRVDRWWTLHLSYSDCKLLWRGTEYFYNEFTSNNSSSFVSDHNGWSWAAIIILRLSSENPIQIWTLWTVFTSYGKYHWGDVLTFHFKQKTLNLKREQLTPDASYTTCPKLNPVIYSIKITITSQWHQKNLAMMQTLVLDIKALSW